MKYPVIYRILAVIQLLISIILLVMAAALTSTITKSDTISLMMITGLMFIVSFGLWFLVASVAWFFGSKYSYVFLYTSIISFLPLVVFFIYDALKHSQKKILPVLLVVLTILAIHMIFLISASVYPKVRKWSNQMGPGLKTMANPIILAIFLAVMLGGHGLVYIVNESGTYKTLKPYSIKSSGDSIGHPSQYVSDDNLSTWWIPGYRTGTGEWIKIEFISLKTVSAIEILGGAHSSERTEEKEGHFRVFKWRKDHYITR